MNDHKSFFQFQQFSVWHDRCAMKVGTDGVLIGSWCGVEGAETALDVGCGSGLIALMLAQRNPSLQVLGIDIDEAAVSQAQENFQRSPFADRLKTECADFTRSPLVESSPLGELEGAFSLIVSNPPFYKEDTKAPDQLRAHARHSTSLPFDTLIRHSAELLAADGHLAVILPNSAASDFILTARTSGLHLQRRCDVRTTAQKPFKRTMLELGFNQRETHFEELTLHTSDGDLSSEYKTLTSAFYL